MPKNQVNKSQNRAPHHNGQAAPSELDQFFELSFDMLCIAGTDGYFKQVNSAFEHTLGWSIDQLLAKPIMEFVHPDDRASTLAVIEKLAEGSDTIMFENRCHCEDGSYKRLSWNIRPTMNNTLYGVVRDLTERKEVEESLRENSQRYQVLFEDSPISLWEEDFTGVKAYIDELRHDGVTDLSSYFDDHPNALDDCITKVKIMDVNQATIELYEAKDKEDFFSGLHRVFGEGSADDFKNEIVFLADGHMKFEQEVINYTLTGDRKYLSFRAQIAPNYEETWGKVLISIVDVTERVLVEWALRESSQRYQSLFEDSPISLWEEDLSAVKRYLDNLGDLGVMDLDTHFANNPDKLLDCIENVRITDVNQATLELYGAKDKESFLQDLNTVFGNDSIEAFKNEIVALAAGHTRFEQEVVNYTLNNERKDLVLRAFIAPGYEDDWSKVLITIIDITSQKNLERQIQGSLERRERQVETSTEIAQEIATAPVLETLFRQVVELVQARFGYYHAHVYTVEGNNLVMQEGTGVAGRKMKEKRHKIALAAKKSLVARSARTGESVLIADVSNEPGWLPNRFLPKTQSELAVPIMLRDEVLGVLDVQNDTIGSLNEEDELMLIGLCGQIAIAIEHHRAETERQQAAEALRQSEARLAEALTMAQLGHWELDIASQMFTFNDQFYALLATDAEQEGGYLMPLAQYAETFLPPEEVDLVAEETTKAIETNDPNYQHELEHRIIRADGTKGYFLVRIRAIQDEQGQTIKAYGASQDITERKRAETQIAERVELATFQAEVGLTLTQSTNLQEMLQRCTETIVEHLEAAFARIWLFDPIENMLELQASAGLYTHLDGEHARVPINQSKISLIAQERQAHLTNDALNDPGVTDKAWAKREGMVAFAGYPLLIEDKLVGVIAMFARHPLSDLTVQALGIITNSIALAVENRQTEAVLAKRATELETVTQLSTQVASVLEPEHLLQSVVDLTKEGFDLYHAHIYLLNETGNMLNLAAGAGEVGHQMVADHWRIPLYREDSIVAQTARSRQGVIVNDVLQTRNYLPNPRLPDTRSEMAVPIIAGDQLLGVLDVQADRLNRFIEEDLRIQTTLATQVAVALQNARSFERSEEALAELDLATRRLTREGWQSYLNTQTHAIMGFAYDLNELEAIEDTPPVIDPVEPVLSHSLRVQGESIGQLALVEPQLMTDTAAEIIDAVMERLSIHLENLRLSEQTQMALVEQERLTRELETVAKVSATTSSILDAAELLQTVVDLTKESFNLYHAHIYLFNEEENFLHLIAGADKVGRKLVDQGWHIPLYGEQSLVARAGRERQGVIVNNVREIPDFLPNPLLPDTQSEMAVPMIIGDRLAGVLDVQSDKVDHFSEDDIRIQTTLAAQIAVAHQNAVLYDKQASTIERLRELEQLKSSFLASMSHELRTPLNSIIGFAELILAGIHGSLVDTLENDMKVIQKNGQHLLSLINDVLDMAKIEAGRMNLQIERFNLHELLEEAIDITAPLAREKSLTLNLAPDGTEPLSLEADRFRMRQIMINLVSNAIKFTETGRVTIETEQTDEWVRIAVHDTGIGIPPDQTEIIFEAFRQVDSSTTRKVGGTGLGLLICRHLVELHGGKLWVESAGVPGEGSTFYVELPSKAAYQAAEDEA